MGLLFKNRPVAIVHLMPRQPPRQLLPPLPPKRIKHRISSTSGDITIEPGPTTLSVQAVTSTKGTRKEDATNEASSTQEEAAVETTRSRHLHNGLHEDTTTVEEGWGLQVE